MSRVCRSSFRYLTLSVLLVVFASLLLASCSSFPGENEKQPSMLILLEDRSRSFSSDMEQSLEAGDDFKGQLYLVAEDGTRRPIHFNREGLYIRALAPGTYRLIGRGAQRGNESRMDQISIPADSVLLYSQNIKNENSGFSFGSPIDSDDRLYVVQTLTSYVGFHQWLGKEYRGFGPYRPKMYLSGRHFDLDVASSPKGAEVFIDGDLWGETPSSIELAEGKYLLEVRKEGYRSFKRIISVDEDLEISAELEEVERSVGDDERKDSFDIMVYPILPFSSEQDNTYGNLFSGTIEVNFSKEAKLNPVSYATYADSVLEDGEAATDGEYPDFRVAEAAGVDLVVTGKYELREESLLLQTTLYEAKSQRVKYADTYRGEAGIAVFDLVDRLSEIFVEEVSRVLPEPGEPIIEKEEEMSAELLTYEKSVYRRRMVDERIERGHLLWLSAGIGGIMDDGDLDDSTWWGVTGGGELSMFQLGYSHPVNQSLSLAADLEANITEIGVDVDSDSFGEATAPVTIYSLLLGPEFDFRTETSEIFFKPLLRVGYAGSKTVSLDQDYSIGPLWYAGLNMDMGYRYFFYQRAGQRPFFLSLGFLIDLVEFRTGANVGMAFVDLHAKLYAGAGMGL